MTIPTLETARLTLRGHSLNDFDESLAMWSDPEFARTTYKGGPIMILNRSPAHPNKIP